MPNLASLNSRPMTDRCISASCGAGNHLGKYVPTNDSSEYTLIRWPRDRQPTRIVKCSSSRPGVHGASQSALLCMGDIHFSLSWSRREEALHVVAPVVAVAYRFSFHNGGQAR